MEAGTASPAEQRSGSLWMGERGEERRLLAAVWALLWTGADLHFQNFNEKLQEREGNLARNLCRSWLMIEE